MNSKETLSTGRVTSVGKFATPLAVVLVTMGIFLSHPLSPVKEISMALLVFGIVFNVGAGRWFKGREHAPMWLVRGRVYLNFGVNAVLVYLLGAYWSPIWLLFVLSPVATAIYDTRRRTLAVASAAAAALLVIHAMKGLNTPLDWGGQIARAGFIIVLSLMANELAQRKHR